MCHSAWVMHNTWFYTFHCQRIIISTWHKQYSHSRSQTGISIQWIIRNCVVSKSARACKYRHTLTDTFYLSHTHVLSHTHTHTHSLSNRYTYFVWHCIITNYPVYYMYCFIIYGSPRTEWFRESSENRVYNNYTKPCVPVAELRIIHGFIYSLSVSTIFIYGLYIDTIISVAWISCVLVVELRIMHVFIYLQSAVINLWDICCFIESTIFAWITQYSYSVISVQWTIETVFNWCSFYQTRTYTHTHKHYFSLSLSLTII